MQEFTAPMFSTKVHLGRRTFFFDVRKTKGDKPYVKITESSVKEGQKQRNNLMVFENEIEDFKVALSQVFGFLDSVK